MKLDATKRTSGKSSALRNQGRLPAVVYNKEFNVPVAIDAKSFDRVFRQQGTSSLIDLDVDGENHQVVVREVQMDKRRRVPQHVDFFAITAGQQLEVHVPIEFVGTSIGQKAGGQLDVHRREIGILVLPRDIPHDIKVDISDLEIGDSIHVGDVRSLLPADADVIDDEALTLVSVMPPRLEEEAEPAEDEGAEPEVIGRDDEDEDESDGEGEGGESPEGDD